MTIEEQTRAMLAPADPAHDIVIPPTVSAAELIAGTQESNWRRPGLHRRRLVLVGGAVVAAASATAYLLPKRSANPAPDAPLGQVLTPIGYQLDTDPQPAAPQLRALAARIADAPYDNRSGRYAYRHAKFWSGTTLAKDGFLMGFVEEEQNWTARDGSGRSRKKTLSAQFPNDASRRYWERVFPTLGWPPIPSESVENIPPGGAVALQPPTSPTELGALLKAQYGAADATKWTMELYRRYIVPKSARAQVLQILSTLDGFVWRGAATDRAGRSGVAVSVSVTPPADNTDRNPYECVLILHPGTGELLAYEQTLLTPRREPSFYSLILDSDWTDRLG
jgi:hypothetical protein